MTLGWFMLGVATGLIASGVAILAAQAGYDPHNGYKPCHLAGRPVAQDEIDHALNDTRRQLRHHIAPWAARASKTTKPRVSHYPPSDETVTKP